MDVDYTAHLKRLFAGVIGMYILVMIAVLCYIFLYNFIEIATALAISLFGLTVLYLYGAMVIELYEDASERFK